MAKISSVPSYPLKSTPVGADTVIGTDSQTVDKETKQFTVQGIVDLAQGHSLIHGVRAFK